MDWRHRSRLWLLVGLFVLTTAALAGERPADPADPDQAIRQLKKDVLDINKELFVLEEELLFPTNTQVAVFLSLDSGRLFALDAVEVRIDDRRVSDYLYTRREVEALRRGGVHRVYFGNLKAGKHEIVAFFTGLGPKGRPYRRAAKLAFVKRLGPKYIELRVVDRQDTLQPEFRIREWD